VQVHDYVLITLPQAVRYGEGVSGEIRIDVHGNPVEWERSRDSAAFRAKVRPCVGRGRRRIVKRRRRRVGLRAKLRPCVRVHVRARDRGRGGEG
jgi:hypothetical protein